MSSTSAHVVLSSSEALGRLLPQPRWSNRVTRQRSGSKKTAHGGVGSPRPVRRAAPRPAFPPARRIARNRSHGAPGPAATRWQRLRLRVEAPPALGDAGSRAWSCDPWAPSRARSEKWELVFGLKRASKQNYLEQGFDSIETQTCSRSDKPRSSQSRRARLTSAGFSCWVQ